MLQLQETIKAPLVRILNTPFTHTNTCAHIYLDDHKTTVPNKIIGLCFTFLPPRLLLELLETKVGKIKII